MKKAILLALAIVVSLTTFAEITVTETIYDGTNLSVTAVNTENNYYYNLSNTTNSEGMIGLTLAVKRIDGNKPAAVTTADFFDDNYWERLINDQLEAFDGLVTAKDIIFTVNIEGVDFPQNLFADYTSLERIDIKANGDYTLAQGLFSGCTALRIINEEVTGSLIISNKAVPTKVENDVYSAVNATAWNEYKAANGCVYTVNIHGLTIKGGRIAFQGKAPLDFDEETPSLAQRNLGDVENLTIDLSQLTVTFPYSKKPASVELIYSINANNSDEAVTHIVPMDNINTAGDESIFSMVGGHDVDFSQLTHNTEYTLSFYWLVQDVNGNDYTLGQDNTRYRVYFKYHGTEPTIMDASITFMGMPEIFLTEEEFEPMSIDTTEGLVLHDFRVNVINRADEVYMGYTIKDDTEQQILAGDELNIGEWRSSTPGIDLAKGLEPGRHYTLAVRFVAQNTFGSDVYDNGGLTYKFFFMAPKTDGIEEITNSKSTISKFYDLSGREVTNPTKGIFVVNGHKVVVR
jgi:hypothetical protein